MPVITGAAQYPENLIEKMEALGIKVDAMDCLSSYTDNHNILCHFACPPMPVMHQTCITAGIRRSLHIMLYR